MRIHFLYFVSTSAFFSKPADTKEFTTPLVMYARVEEALQNVGYQQHCLYNVTIPDCVSLTQNDTSFTLEPVAVLTCTSIRSINENQTYVTCFAAKKELEQKMFLYKGNNYVLHTGSKGGQYILVSDKKVYVQVK